MNWRRRSCFLVALLIALVSPQLTYGQQAADAAVYDQFRAWSSSRPAETGWTVTGFDPAEEAVAAAQQQARQLGVEIKTSITGNEDFDFGKDRWDLIVLSYVGFRNTIPKMLESLKPGGRIVLEAFHRDSLKNGAIGAGVVFDSNELLKVFDAFRIVHYEDAQDKSDFGTGTTNRVVRLVAEKR
jgi:SAM-dependent methyltransferase